MNNLSYMPLTASPFRQSEEYQEVLPRSAELSEYIRCFWGSGQPYSGKERETSASLIVPDTCVDIIYHIDHTDNTIEGGFCGINDASFKSFYSAKSGHLVSVFAIRFYAWSAYVFAEDSLRDTLNGYDDVQSRFCWLDVVLRQQLLEKRTLKERMEVTEGLLLKKLDAKRQNDVVDNAIQLMLMRRGTLNSAELAQESFVSSRQLERLFHEYVGITPKKLCNLVRYQFLWNEIVRNPAFHILDAVHKYRYTDQSHLIREFKRYHAADIRTAKQYACNHVGKIQYSHIGG